MRPTDCPDEVPKRFSSAKKAVLALPERRPNSTLGAVARTLGISRAAARKHLTRLEESGLIEGESRLGRPGRPAALYRRSASSRHLSREAYTELCLGALAFVERRLGRPAVVNLFHERADGLRARHRSRLARRDPQGRVRELARIYDEEGSMAKVDRGGPRRFKRVEHHCPILAVAGRYGEACDIERRLFHDLPEAPVEVRHRVIAGDGVCRFGIRTGDRPERA